MEAVSDDVTGAAFACCLHDIRAYRECKGVLAHEPRSVAVAGCRTHVLVIGQAPGRIVHETGIPWNDHLGDCLHQWLQISYDDFYADGYIAVVPVGFCLPSTGTNGDLPSRPEYAPRQHRSLLTTISGVRLALLADAYAQRNYLDVPRDWTLTDVVRSGSACDADGRVLFPLPHPNPRNLV